MQLLRNAIARLSGLARKVWDSWVPRKGEPRFWEVFASLAVVGAVFLTGYLTTVFRIVAAFIVTILAACTTWRYRVWRYRKKQNTLKGFERTSIASVIVFTSLLTGAGIVYDNWRHGHIPPVIPPSSSAQPAPAGKSPVFSYFAFPSRNFEDIDVRIANRGFVRQVFTARSSIISSIVVIASRTPTPASTFSLSAIGLVRLQIEEVSTSDMARAKGYVPIALADSDRAPSPAGVVVQAGPNHKNTTFDLAPVAVKVGGLYAFVITNLCGSWMAFSLHGTGVPGDPLYMFGYNFHQYLDERTNRALTGYVCDTTNCS